LKDDVRYKELEKKEQKFLNASPEKKQRLIDEYNRLPQEQKDIIPKPGEFYARIIKPEKPKMIVVPPFVETEYTDNLRGHQEGNRLLEQNEHSGGQNRLLPPQNHDIESVIVPEEQRTLHENLLIAENRDFMRNTTPIKGGSSEPGTADFHFDYQAKVNPSEYALHQVRSEDIVYDLTERGLDKVNVKLEAERKTRENIDKQFEELSKNKFAYASNKEILERAREIEEKNTHAYGSTGVVK
jgi:hypothetical protein